ncbi:MAG: hypothetical protein JSV80_07280, partial [Acidobacteriota bacterium]
DYLFGAPASDAGATRTASGALFVLPGERLNGSVKVLDMLLVTPAQRFDGASADDRLADHGWLAVAELDGSAGLEVVAPTAVGDGPSDARASAGEARLVSQGDRDGDGVPDINDCAPDDPSSAGSADNTGTASGWSSDKTTFDWADVAGATSYNFYRGTIQTPWQYNETCLQSALSTSQGTDASQPASGLSFWYDSIAIVGVCQGPLGDDSGGGPRPDPPACP